MVVPQTMLDLTLEIPPRIMSVPVPDLANQVEALKASVQVLEPEPELANRLDLKITLVAAPAPANLLDSKPDTLDNKPDLDPRLVLDPALAPSEELMQMPV